MARFPSLSSASWTTAFVSSLALFSTIIPSTRAQSSSSSDTIQGTNGAGVTHTLLVDRYPALYSGDFGDCMGGQSLLNLTSYDAAYYADNMTVLFNLAGTTNLRNESLMLYISVYAYGEDRFDLVFNPCNANFASLCPLNASVPITGGAVIPVSTSDVSAIPNIALSIPDFEASVQLRIFSNASQTQIGCFSAVMRNGATFSHPAAVGSVLGIFTFVAVVASFATAIYGVSVPHMRTHYAHSLSVLVVFEVFQSIFFSGALSLNWPSVCAAFWSNFAWSAGMIYTPTIISSINSFTGVSGNASQVGGAGSTVLNNNGGLQQQIYGRALSAPHDFARSERIASRIYERAMEDSPFELARRSEQLASHLIKRATNSTDKTSERLFAWAGVPVSPGLPIPGNWSGFAGELSMVNVPAADAFMTGFLWFLILLAILIGATIAFKFSLEGLSAIKWIKNDRFAMFRSHWKGFTGLIVLRSCFIAFFMLMTLALFQFSSGGKAGPIAIAVIVFLIFFVGAIGLTIYACFYRVKFGKYESSPDRIHFKRKNVLKVIPWYKTVRESSMDEQDKGKTAGSVSFFQIRFVDHDSEQQSVHQNAAFTKRFGWLASRYRRTRWWFFGFWVVYQFVRACFIGGASQNPTAQVFGIFIWEIIAFIAIICINPFEGARNTALAVYMLGISKVVTAGLSIAFLPQFNVARIPTTIIGIIIIICQGFLTIGLLILIVLGAISSYMSLTRNREEFKPHSLENIRMKYFGHLETKEKDVPPPPPPVPEEPKEPYFQVKTVRRAPKIEDEDVDFVPDLAEFNPGASQPSLAGPASRSRANSMGGSMRSHYSSYGNVPYGARVHRASWSSRDFNQYHEEHGANSPFGTPGPSRSASGMSQHISNNSIASRAPLVRPQASHSSLRPSTPTREQQQKFANQRVAHAS
ncbi:related to Calcium_related spray protein [Phialocephala subalpina]|uniref:Related to Calcium_related spray protein n=1 Tax=Phialocephala subalpina TaxID=576137 RepID=A0A1L7WFG6_9HELO|nr:related to Calcium_related spray protein [Phialocephala subalpina]